MHMYGMWVALGVASAFVVYFLRITALTERDRELADAKNLAARQERLASLATMAAGAAHELSTPLGTVALVAKELEHQLATYSDRRLADDARLIREQVGRCRVILDQVAGGAGTAGEGGSAGRRRFAGGGARRRPASPVVRCEIEPAAGKRRCGYRPARSARPCVRW